MSTAAFAATSYDSWPVATVRVVVHNLGPVKPGANISYNHWTISLLVAADMTTLTNLGPQNSVRLDMKPEGPENGTLSITRLNYLVTTNATKWFDFPVSHAAGIVNVGKVKNLLQTKGRHKYRMTEHGGCQWWWQVFPSCEMKEVLTCGSWNVVKDLTDARILMPTAAVELQNVLRNNYSVTLPPVAHNIELGTFY